MAEISYPFNADNASGGTKLVSQVQWQRMSHLWGGDRIDFQLTATSYGTTDLPFNASIVNGRTLQIQPGKAYVGGFYYELTAPLSVTVPNNGGTTPRKDLVVIQLDMTKSAVNIVLIQGTPSAAPVAPRPRRQIGGFWELPLYEVDAAANNASVTAVGRMPFDLPPRVAFPWNVADGAAYLPRGSFAYDMDNNGGDSPYEAFVGRDGYVQTRTLGKARSYTPALVGATALAANLRTGHWRFTAPNQAWFQLTLTNSTTKSVTLTSGNWRMGVTLPWTSYPNGVQTCHGYFSNPTKADGWPNMLPITATTQPQSTTLWLHRPSENPADGLDGLTRLPAKSTLYLSGTYELNLFNE
jgi:hypothetical protein